MLFFRCQVPRVVGSALFNSVQPIVVVAAAAAAIAVVVNNIIIIIVLIIIILRCSQKELQDQVKRPPGTQAGISDQSWMAARGRRQKHR